LIALYVCTQMIQGRARRRACERIHEGEQCVAVISSVGLHHAEDCQSTTGGKVTGLWTRRQTLTVALDMTYHHLLRHDGTYALVQFRHTSIQQNKIVPLSYTHQFFNLMHSLTPYQLISSLSPSLTHSQPHPYTFFQFFPFRFTPAQLTSLRSTASIFTSLRSDCHLHSQLHNMAA
jgi:hypothetical protein